MELAHQSSALLVFNNAHSGMVDNLAYLDTPLTAEQMLSVKSAIEEFQLTFSKRDYLSDLPLPKLLSENEMQQIKSGKKTQLVFKSDDLITSLQDR